MSKVEVELADELLAEIDRQAAEECRTRELQITFLLRHLMRGAAAVSRETAAAATARNESAAPFLPLRSPKAAGFKPLDKTKLPTLEGPRGARLRQYLAMYVGESGENTDIADLTDDEIRIFDDLLASEASTTEHWRRYCERQNMQVSPFGPKGRKPLRAVLAAHREVMQKRAAIAAAGVDEEVVQMIARALAIVEGRLGASQSEVFAAQKLIEDTKGTAEYARAGGL